MLKLIFSTFIENGSIIIKLNDKRIAKNSGRFEFELDKSESYLFSWQVVGEAGSTYTISVSSPKEAELQLTKTIGKKGKDSNSYQFNT